MPIFDVEANGRQFEVEAPDLASAQAAFSQSLSASSAAAPTANADATFADVGKSAGIGLLAALLALRACSATFPNCSRKALTRRATR